MKANKEDPRRTVGGVGSGERNRDDMTVEELCQSFPPPLRRNCMTDDDGRWCLWNNVGKQRTWKRSKRVSKGM